MKILISFIRDLLWYMQCYLKSWSNIIENIDLWIVWLISDPNHHITPFDYWQFWNDLNGNHLSILFEDAKVSFYSLYPDLELDDE